MKDDALYFPGLTGCTDMNCLLRCNHGLGTNGGCQCIKALNRTAEGFAAVRTILFLRQQWTQQAEGAHEL